MDHQRPVLTNCCPLGADANCLLPVFVGHQGPIYVPSERRGVYFIVTSLGGVYKGNNKITELRTI
jgi:hypothetical protein